MDQSTAIVFALVGVLLVAGASVVLLGRNAARSANANEEINTSIENSDELREKVEGSAQSAQVAVLEKVDEETIGISRRKFMNRSIYGLLGIGFALPFAASLLAFLIPTGKGGFGGIVNVTTSVDDIISQIRNQKKPFYIPEARAYIVEFPNDNPAAVEAAKATPAYEIDERVLKGMTEDGIVALYQKCPHLGCRVPWCDTSQWFECPCHGSKYNRVGEKTGGPAPRGMDRFGFELSGGRMTIDTATIVSGPPNGVDTTRQGAEGPVCV